MSREAPAPADTRSQEHTVSRDFGWTNAIANVLGRLQRARAGLPQVVQFANPRNWRRLALTWLAIVGFATVTAGLLLALGPPRTGSPEAERAMGSARPQPGAARSSSLPSIAALLARVEEAITDSPDGAPPGADAAQTLEKIAGGLPTASAEDRRLSNNMASDLFDRATIALNAGRIGEEQRWLALGAILAPPPELSPHQPQGTRQPAPQASGAAPEARRDETPNEAEAEAANPPASAGAPAPASAAEAKPVPQPAPADRASAPELRARGDRSSDVASAQPDAATPESADRSASMGAADATGAGAAVVIHFRAGSETAQARANALAERLGEAYGRAATQSVTDLPTRAVIRYASQADHARAREIGRMLGSMGYSWHLQRLPSADAGSGAPNLDVWLPAG